MVRSGVHVILVVVRRYVHVSLLKKVNLKNGKSVTMSGLQDGDKVQSGMKSVRNVLLPSKRQIEK